MEWDDKVKMIQLSNIAKSNNCTEAQTKEFNTFILDRINEFDDQAWNMFFHIIELTVDNMLKNLSFYNEIYQFTKELTISDFASSMRLDVFKSICANELNLDFKID